MLHKMFIDHESFVIYCPHPTIEQNLWAVMEPVGNKHKVVSYKKMRKMIDGSYNKRIAISSFEEDYYQDFTDKYLEKIPTLPKGYSPFIRVEGNPTKFLQGHNVFGSRDIYALAFHTLKKCLTQLEMTDIIPTAHQHVYRHDWVVTRIDLTKMINVGTDEDVNRLLRKLAETSSMRSSDVTRCKNTVYFGASSGLWAAKAYNKHYELEKGSKDHRLPFDLANSGLQAFCKGQLRFELVIRKALLDRLELSNPQKLQRNLDELYEKLLGNINMSEQKIIDDTAVLPRHLQATYLHWKNGEDMEQLLHERTYRRHRSALKQYGIDIKLKPLDESKHKVTYPSLKKVLTLSEVTNADIPPHLQDYLFSPSPLRVA